MYKTLFRYHLRQQKSEHVFRREFFYSHTQTRNLRNAVYPNSTDRIINSAQNVLKMKTSFAEPSSDNVLLADLIILQSIKISQKYI